MEYFHSESLIKSVFYRKSLKKDKLFKEELMRYTTIKEFMLSDFARASKFCFGFPGNIQQFEQWAVLAERYDVWRTRTQPLESIYRVPKKLHQIWIGGPLPAEYDLWTGAGESTTPVGNISFGLNGIFFLSVCVTRRLFAHHQVTPSNLTLLVMKYSSVWVVFTWIQTSSA